MRISFSKSNGKSNGFDRAEATRLTSDASNVADGCRTLVARSEAQAQHVDAAISRITKIAESLRRTAGQAESVATSGEELASSANEMAASIEQVTAGTASLAASIAETAASVEETSRSIANV